MALALSPDSHEGFSTAKSALASKFARYLVFEMALSLSPVMYHGFSAAKNSLALKLAETLEFLL